jgi:hypothetical protein
MVPKAIASGDAKREPLRDRPDGTITADKASPITTSPRTVIRKQAERCIAAYRRSMVTPSNVPVKMNGAW